MKLIILLFIFILLSIIINLGLLIFLWIYIKNKCQTNRLMSKFPQGNNLPQNQDQKLKKFILELTKRI